MINLDIVCRAILEACKVLGYPEPSPYYRNYFESLDHMPTDVLCQMYSETERTPCIVDLIDYVICIGKLFSSLLK